MLSDDRLLEIFREFFPSDGPVAVVLQDKQDYVEHALKHPFIRMQIEIGLYDRDKFGDQFTGWARSHTEVNLVIVCPELGRAVLDGIPDDIAEEYARHIAHHERHHFQNDHRPATVEEHLLSETECVANTQEGPAVEYVNTHSPLFVRLNSVIAALKAKYNIHE